MTGPEDCHTNLGKPGNSGGDGGGGSERIQPAMWTWTPLPLPDFRSHGQSPASPLARLAAVFIDVAICIGCMVGVAVIGEAVHGSTDVTDIVYAAMWFVLLFGYSPLFTRLWGGTLGKVVLRIRVVKVSDGSPLSYRRALGRHLVHVGMQCVPLLNPIDSLFCTWDKPLGQCLHDKVADTAVVKR
ncbi:RDD family protein [Streptomyces sp. NPDC012623]|uniref:RDD family protein n=1 Tax=unclassified Streptomyces TaxID=2593676 RepID=UPI0036738CCF